MPLHSPDVSTKLSTGPIAGVYLLFDAGELSYIGRSDNCRKRIASHDTNGRPFDHWEIIECGAGAAVWIEQALIRAMAPTQNRVLFRARATQKTIYIPEVPDPSEHPDMLLNKTKARDRARRFGLLSEFDVAIQTGALVFSRRNPESTQRFPALQIPVGDLLNWCVQARAQKAAT